jgi:K+-transporting ATPase ATPase C chain
MKTLIISIRALLVFTIICGGLYTFSAHAISNILFPNQAQGSLIKNENSKIIGSELIGQKFDAPKYFQSRPSAIDNNPMPSGGSNLAPTNEKLKSIVDKRADDIHKNNYVKNKSDIPQDLLFASGSGVDPHISPSAAYFQIDRIAKIRNFDKDKINKLYSLVDKSVEERDLYVFGERRVNVLKLNTELDKIK